MSDEEKHEYPIRVLVSPGPDWRAWESDDDPGPGEMVWRARRVPVSECVLLDVEYLAEVVEEYMCDAVPDMERVFAVWDDPLLTKRDGGQGGDSEIAVLLDRLFRSEVMQLAPGLSPKDEDVDNE